MPGKKTEPSRIEIYDDRHWDSAEQAPEALTGTYDGDEYRLVIKTVPSAPVPGIGLDQDGAQRLALWLGQDAREEHGRQQAGAQWHPDSGEAATVRRRVWVVIYETFDAGATAEVYATERLAAQAVSQSSADSAHYEKREILTEVASRD